ncbi:glycosyltransferase family 2 protein [Tropicibacter sp. Alg240-R139]|uniref:glycosyltransferase family 2 protein n=1 Tax=Tropicibacter sp. Alg240-R139 TaxID=2305991 RepID=UPI001F07B0C3|nr:glycosyltransferase [Tropicibacter sp. Alg240-R139]
MQVTVGIASTGRPAILRQMLKYMGTLADLPDKVVVSIAEPQDFDGPKPDNMPFELSVITSTKGSCAQRNAILRSEVDSDIVLFLDDDFLIAEGYVAELRRLFAQDPSIMIATGQVLADGARGPGLAFDDAAQMLGQAGPANPTRSMDIRSGYGCNMAVRVMASPDLFDEKLPLYGWLEDLDLSRRAAWRGRVVRADGLLGVHLGIKSGRTPGVRLGYSQIANPVYMLGKGTLGRRHAFRLMSRNFAANLLGAIKPPPYLDRRGRLRGNLIAMGDILRRRSNPQRILELD